MHLWRYGLGVIGPRMVSLANPRSSPGAKIIKLKRLASRADLGVCSSPKPHGKRHVLDCRTQYLSRQHGTPTASYAGK